MTTSKKAEENKEAAEEAFGMAPDEEEWCCIWEATHRSISDAISSLPQSASDVT